MILLGLYLLLLKYLPLPCQWFLLPRLNEPGLAPRTTTGLGYKLPITEENCNGIFVVRSTTPDPSLLHRAPEKITP